MTTIYALSPDGEITEAATYDLPPQRAMIAFYMQRKRNDYNTWKYPDTLPELRQAMDEEWYFTAKDGTLYSTVTEDPVEQGFRWPWQNA